MSPVAESALPLVESLLRAAESDAAWDTEQAVYLSGQPVKGAAPRKLLEMHQSHARGRMLRGANRSGKTTWAVYELIWTLMGKHPFRNDLPSLPVHARAVCPTLPTSMDSQHAQRDRLRQICPPHLLRGGSWVDAWNNRAFSLTFANGSRVQFASSDQEAQTQAGISDVGVLWVDEECPREHFTENLRAMVNVPHSFWFMTYWPEQKYAWVRDYYDDAAAGKVPTVTVGPVITMLDNVHNLGEQAVSDFEASITPAEAKSRMGGEYAAGEDLVFGGLEIPTVAAV